MKLRLLLANWAEVQNQLLYLLGGGWTRTGPGPSVFAVVAMVQVGWDETSRKHKLEISFEDADGPPILVRGPVGDQPLRIAAEFEMGRPPGAPPGTSFMMPLAIPIGPVQFPPGRQCVVKALVNGEILDELSFSVRPPQSRPAAPTP